MMKKPETEKPHNMHNMHVAEIILMCSVPGAEEDKKHHDDT